MRSSIIARARIKLACCAAALNRLTAQSLACSPYRSSLNREQNKISSQAKISFLIFSARDFPFLRGVQGFHPRPARRNYQNRISKLFAPNNRGGFRPRAGQARFFAFPGAPGCSQVANRTMVPPVAEFIGLKGILTGCNVSKVIIMFFRHPLTVNEIAQIIRMIIERRAFEHCKAFHDQISFS